jgi:hypothetical protein
MRYFTVTEEELQSARPGLTLVERLIEDHGESFSPFLYGITIKDSVLSAVNDELERDYEEEIDGKTAPKATEVALAIPFRAETIDLLTGSGVALKNEEFAYRAGNDDTRTNWLYARNGILVTINDFDTLALSDSDSWLDEFLKQHGFRGGAVDADVIVPRDPGKATQLPAAKEPVTLEGQRQVASLKAKGKKASYRSPFDFFLNR